MSHFTHHLLSPTDRFNYTMITPEYSPDTTVAIRLRNFEKDSKTQAETEYDAEHGPMPEPPADDDDSIDIQERTILKKKRKVRSAIVSRRKTAIYEKKLEDELQLRDNINAEFKATLSVQQDVLRDIRAKIHTLQRTLDARKHVPKRMRTALPQHPITHIPQPNNVFFPDNDPIDEILSISQDQSRPIAPITKAVTNINDLSECSDRQISPMLQPQRSDQAVRDFPCGFPAEDNSWKTFFRQNAQPPVAQLLGASFAM